MLSEALVKMYLPYEKVVYDLELKSSNAKRIERFRAYQKAISEMNREAGDEQSPENGEE